MRQQFSGKTESLTLTKLTLNQDQFTETDKKTETNRVNLEKCKLDGVKMKETVDKQKGKLDEFSKNAHTENMNSLNIVTDLKVAWMSTFAPLM